VRRLEQLDFSRDREIKRLVPDDVFFDGSFHKFKVQGSRFKVKDKAFVLNFEP
jgi:hypothetical protein